MKQNQKSIVLQHLKTLGRITTLDATYDYQIFRLSERIRELESDGHAILHIPFQTETGRRCMEYRLSP